MKKFAWGIVLAAMLASACSHFSYEEAIFIAYNTSNDAVEFHVNDGTGYRVGAQSSREFTVEVPIPNNPVYRSSVGPSTADKTTEVSVAAKNLVTGELTQPTICRSGAKRVAHLTYRKENSRVSCTTSY